MSAIGVCIIMLILPNIATLACDLIIDKFITKGVSLAQMIVDDVSVAYFIKVILLSNAVRLISYAADIAVMTLILSQTGFFLKIAEEKEATLKTFAAEKRYFESLKTGLLVAVKVFLWSLLFIIPGIIKAISYTLTPYLKYKNPNQSVSDCIKESSRLMDGYKMSLFILYLTFIGWFLLIAFAQAFIGMIPFAGLYINFVVGIIASAALNAYVNASVAVFYKERTFPFLAKMYGRGHYHDTDRDKHIEPFEEIKTEEGANAIQERAETDSGDGVYNKEEKSGEIKEKERENVEKEQSGVEKEVKNVEKEHSGVQNEMSGRNVKNNEEK